MGLSLLKNCRPQFEKELRNFLQKDSRNTFALLSGGKALSFRWSAATETLSIETTPTSENESLFEKHRYRKLENSASLLKSIHPFKERMIPSICEESLSLLQEGHGCTPTTPVRFELVLENFKHPGNPELLRALRNLRQADTPTLRESFYSALLNALLLVPTDPKDPEGKRILQIEKKEGGAITPIFTDTESLDRFLKNHSCFAMPGYHLFPWAAKMGFESFALNPADPHVAVLPKSDIEMLAQAADRWKASLKRPS